MDRIEFISLLVSLLAYLCASLLYAAQFIAIKTPRLPLTLPIDGYNQKRIYINKYSPATYLTLLGLLANSFSLIFRYTRTGHPPLGNMFEFLLFFIWGIALTYLVIEFKYNLKQIGMFALPLIFALNSWLITMDTSLNPLMPALRSNWLYFHVFTAVVSYGAFAISFVIGLMYLIKDRFLIRNLYSNFVHALPELDSLEELSYKLILVGMPFLTLVIITGAIWAEMAWGTYWSWDPKETWSLITWFIYAAYLHTRFTKNLKGRLSIALVVIGFLAVLFTFAGVNILLPGLHSYA